MARKKGRNQRYKALTQTTKAEKTYQEKVPSELSTPVKKFCKELSDILKTCSQSVLHTDLAKVLYGFSISFSIYLIPANFRIFYNSDICFNVPRFPKGIDFLTIGALEKLIAKEFVQYHIEVKKTYDNRSTCAYNSQNYFTYICYLSKK